MKKLLKIFLFVLIVLFIGASVTVIGVLLKYKSELTNMAEIVENYNPSIPTIIYDRNGVVIDALYREAREVAKLDEIPKNVQNAFISIEDKKFYSHNGVHFKRIVGAMIANLKKGKTVQGGSSITQQLAKNAFLTQEKKLSRKIKELLITFEIERRYTKDEILEKYLNEIYFGSGLYGIKTAATQFFKKDISELSAAEGALLASVPNFPVKYNPRVNLDNALKRQKIILRQMFKDGKLSDEEYEKALDQKFVNSQKLSDDKKVDENTTIIYEREKNVFYKNPELTIIVENELNKMFNENVVYHDGLKVYTTFDLEIQKISKNKLDNYEFLKNNKKLDGGVATIDSNTGGVIALVGGRNFKAGNFNRATMAKRQYGSSFKPFVYFAAIKDGDESNSTMEDSFISYGKWTPKNYGGRYSYTTTLLNALDKSINTVSIKLLDKVGISKFTEMMKRIDSELIIPDNLTTALGSVEGTPLQLAIDYSIFANGGYKVEPHFISKITDKYNNEVSTEIHAKEKIFDSIDTSIMTFMLQSSVSAGTSHRAQVLDLEKKPIDQGGKTGTTNENRTVWYVGLTPDYVTAIYIGYDNNDRIGGSVTGGTGAAPLWKNIYQELVNKKIYTPSKFLFLDSHIKNGDLIVQRLNINNGLLTNGGRKFVVRQGKMSAENNQKYANGIAILFGIEGATYQEGENSYKIYSTDINNDNEGDSLFKRIMEE